MKLLIYKGMDKRTLSEEADISNTTISKRVKGENVEETVIRELLTRVSVELKNKIWSFNEQGTLPGALSVMKEFNQ